MCIIGRMLGQLYFYSREGPTRHDPDVQVGNVLFRDIAKTLHGRAEKAGSFRRRVVAGRASRRTSAARAQKRE